MRLVEFFTLLELKDRLAHIAEVMGGKIAKRWDEKVNDGGMTGLPAEWRQAIDDGIIPDAMTMSRHDDWAQKYGQKMARWVVEWFSQADPTKNKKYTDWILRQWLSDTLWLEDVAKLPVTLETFEEHRKKLAKMDIVDQEGDPIGPPPERRSDINSWKDYRVLAYAVRPLAGERAAGDKVANMLAKPDIQAMMHHPVPDPQKAFGPEGEWDLDEIRSAHAGETGEDGGQFDTMDWYDFEQPDADVDTTAIEKVYTDDKIAILIPNSRAAACELGKGTEWCTAATSSENYFWHYAPDGPMYVVITDKHGKYQFHFESSQFMDVHDQELSSTQKTELAKEYPQLGQVFHDKATEFGQIWLMSPDKITVDYINELTSGNDDWLPGGVDKSHVLSKIPKGFDGRADEKALQMAEQWLRENNALEAWRYIRQPTEQDLQASLYAEDPTTRGYNPATGIMDYAIKNGIELSDETIEAAVARDGEALMYLPPEKIEANPQWILAAVQDQPRVFEYAIDTIIHEKPVWGDMADEHDQARYQAIIDAVRENPQVATNVARIEPSLAPHMRDWFGTDPWLVALKSAGSHKGSIESIAQDFRVNNMQLDYDKILKFLIDNDAPYVEYVHAIEEHLGELPLWFQKALVKKSWDNLDVMNNPHPELVKMAHERAAPERARQEKIRQGSEAWKAERARLKNSIGEAHNPKVRVKYMPKNNAYYAYLGSNRVGQAQLWDSHDDKVGEDERYVWKSAVHPNYKRQGVATALYDFMAKDLAEKGLKLVPSPDTQLSDEAYQFWKARDPESVKGHGKSKSEPYQKYMGQEVTVKGRPAIVYRVGWSQSSDAPLFGIRYTDVPEGSANSQSYVGMGALE